MDLPKFLQQLNEELDNLNAAIRSLERLHEGSRRRGRPPVWLTNLKKGPRPVHRRKPDGQPGPV